MIWGEETSIDRLTHSIDWLTTLHSVNVPVLTCWSGRWWKRISVYKLAKWTDESVVVRLNSLAWLTLLFLLLCWRRGCYDITVCRIFVAFRQVWRYISSLTLLDWWSSAVHETVTVILVERYATYLRYLTFYAWARIWFGKKWCLFLDFGFFLCIMCIL